ncbi:MAG: HAMP domain-containing protein [Granulosicoccus sp.]|nr:HAMP domain-containing protein [Granulosicoccus sp.]
MRRLSTSLLVAVLISVIGAGWLMDRLFVHLETTDRDAVNVAMGLGEMLVELIDLGDPSHATALYTNDLSDYNVSLMDIEDIGLPESLYSALKKNEPLVLESSENLALYFKLEQTGKVLQIRVPAVSSGDTRLRLLLTLSFYLLLAALLLIWLYPLIRRLRRLAAVSKRFGEGDLTQRVPTSRNSSLHDIESEFNRMAQRLQGLVEDNKMLSGAVSHDLKTPLARLRFGIDALEERLSATTVINQHSDQVNDYLDRINHDLASMEQLVEVLLEFARLDQQLSELPLAPVSLLSVVTDCVDSLTVNSDRQIDVDESIGETCIMADERYASMLVSNLIQNAVKFSRERICIKLGAGDKSKLKKAEGHQAGDFSMLEPSNGASRQVFLTIDDDGPGFEVDSLDRVTKPFEKGSALRDSRSRAGYGLGLAIVARIVQWFGARLQLGKSRTLGGASVSVVFDACD